MSLNLEPELVKTPKINKTKKINNSPMVKSGPIDLFLKSKNPNLYLRESGISKSITLNKTTSAEEGSRSNIVLDSIEDFEADIRSESTPEVLNRDDIS